VVDVEDEELSGHTPASSPLVLVVEADRAIRKLLRSTLRDHQLRVLETGSGTEALAQAASHNPALILLDYDLPDLEGIQVTIQLREWTAAPILVLSSGREDEKIAALDAGANDCLTKPFGTGELLARMRVWLRHTQRAASDAPSAVLEVGPLRIDFGNRLAFLHGEEIRLTPTQYKLFATMMKNAGKVMTHEQLLFSVWGPAYKRETQYLRVYMGQLRRKFEANPARPRLFVTEPGVGYRLRTER
jgi:two-component system KDP operon response regulator KdpE